MYDPDMEELRRDVCFDATRQQYEVKVTLEITYRTTAKSRDEAEDAAYDDIKEALRGSYLDYGFIDFKSEEVE